MCEGLNVSERRACRVLVQYRSAQQHVAVVKSDEDSLAKAIVGLATQYGTAIATLTFPAQSAAIDDGLIEAEAYFTAVGASAVCRVTGRIRHALSITGLSTSVSPTRVAVASAFNSDTASMGLGISLNGGASASWTVSNANAALDSIG